MMVSNRGSIVGLLQWQQRSVIFFAATAAAVIALRELAGWHWLRIPAIPVAVVGGALGIFVSFRTNAAYARWWEGRQLWGRLINLSRMFSSQVLAYLPRTSDGSPSALQRRLIERHILYVHVLRCLLRDQSPWTDEDVPRFGDSTERASLEHETNATHALLDRQLAEVTREADEGRLTPFRLEAFDRSIMGLLDVQGGCERIKRTPMPRGYGYFAEQLVRAFGVLLPLAIAEELWIMAIPINVLVCLAFLMISEVGRVLEDPFTMFWNGLPLSALSRTIESNLLQRLGEDDVRPLLKPDARGILM